MGRITADIGLASGIPIVDTVDQLIALQARPRDLLVERNASLSARQVAFAELTSRLLSFQFYVNRFATVDVFSAQSATSSDFSLLSATVTDTAVNGTYTYTPFQSAQAHQLLSTAFVSDDLPLDVGSFSFRYGGAVDEGINLGLLNGGEGIDRGQIRITDRSGASADVDLRFVQTVDDVLAAVNNNSLINVTLEAHGDQFRLVDNTSQTAANLKVQEVLGGTTAASLGLAGIDIAADQADGIDTVSLHDNFILSQLNDGLGVRLQDTLPDLKFNFRDGSAALNIDFDVPAVDAQQASATTVAAGNVSAQLTFTATAEGTEFDDFTIAFVNDVTVTAGNETVQYDKDAKTLVFRIDEGNTTADDIIAALAGHPPAAADFTAAKTAGDQFSQALTVPANGGTAELQIKAVQNGAAFDGFTLSFVDNPFLTAGEELVFYNPITKQIVFHIDEGATTAQHIEDAALADLALSADFTITAPNHFSSAITTAVGGLDAQVEITSKGPGPNRDGIVISFVDDPTVVQGAETVEFVDGLPGGTIIFNIDAGATTANDIIAAIQADPTVSALFSANLSAGSTGNGLIDVTDTGVTAGGGNDGFISVTDTATTTGGAAGLVDADEQIVTDGGAAIEARSERTLGEILETINDAGEGRLLATIRADGEGITITDLTQDLGGTFTIESVFGTDALADLGLDVAAVGGVITGRRLHSGLKSTLLGNLDGGRGLGPLGTIDLTDRLGATVSVDLSTAETLDDAINGINDQARAAGVAIRVVVNDARNGIQLSDTSGAASGLLVVANADATNTADQLGIAASGDVDHVDGKDLSRQTVNEATLLESYNVGAGVAAGQFRVTNSNGLGTIVTLTTDIETIGQLIEAINDRTIEVEARINDSGDGIVLIDTAGGTDTLTITEVNNGTTAADLHILGDGVAVNIDGDPAQPSQQIEGGTRFDVVIEEGDTLDDLIQTINDQNAGIKAQKLGNGSLGNPFRISLFGERTGADANFLFDTSGVDFSFNETSHAQDALLLFGAATSVTGGVLVSSSNGVFDDVLPGVQLKIIGTSTSPVTVTVALSDSDLVTTATEFVSTYNAIQEKLEELTFFSETDGSSGILSGSIEALRVETDLARFATGRFFGLGKFQSLAEVGISIDDQGQLSLDTQKLKDLFASDREAVTEFFTNEDFGVATKLDKVIESLAGRDSSLLINSSQALGVTVDINSQRIEVLNVQLESRRIALLEDFIRMETIIAKSQSAIQVLQAFTPVPPLGS